MIIKLRRYHLSYFGEHIYEFMYRLNVEIHENKCSWEAMYDKQADFNVIANYFKCNLIKCVYITCIYLMLSK